MGAGSFKADASGIYKSCIECDDGSVAGAAGAGWSLINGFVPGCIISFGYNLGGHCGSGDHIPLLCAFLGAFVFFWPAAAFFIALLVPGALAAGCGAIYGLIRGGPCCSQKDEPDV